MGFITFVPNTIYIVILINPNLYKALLSYEDSKKISFPKIDSVFLDEKAAQKRREELMYEINNSPNCIEEWNVEVISESINDFNSFPPFPNIFVLTKEEKEVLSKYTGKDSEIKSEAMFIPGIPEYSKPKLRIWISDYIDLSIEKDIDKILQEHKLNF